MTLRYLRILAYFLQQEVVNNLGDDLTIEGRIRKSLDKILKEYLQMFQAERMLPPIILLPLLHLLTLGVEAVILFFNIHGFKFINILDEDADQEFRKVGVLVHRFWVLAVLIAH